MDNQNNLNQTEPQPTQTPYQPQPMAPQMPIEQPPVAPMSFNAPEAPKKSNKKLVIIIIAIILALLLIGGLLSVYIGSSSKSSKNINEIGIEYIEEKYDEKCDYGLPYGDSITGTHQLLIKCAGFPDQNILVRIDNYKKDNKIFSDNYLAVKYRDDTIELIRGYAKKIFGEANVFYYVDYQALSNELSATATFNDFISNKSTPLNIDIEVKSSSFISKEQVGQVAKLIAVNGTRFTLRVIVVDDSVYGTFDDKTIEKYVQLRKYVHCAVISKLNGEIDIRWL